MIHGQDAVRNPQGDVLAGAHELRQALEFGEQPGQAVGSLRGVVEEGHLVPGRVRQQRPGLCVEASERQQPAGGLQSADQRVRCGAVDRRVYVPAPSGETDQRRVVPQRRSRAHSGVEDPVLAPGRRQDQGVDAFAGAGTSGGVLRRTAGLVPIGSLVHVNTAR